MAPLSRTVVEYEVEGGAQLVFVKKVDSESLVAVAGADLTCSINQSVSFDASGSLDNIGIIKYTLSLGDGLEVAGEKVAHRYDHPGDYTVLLRVVDITGNTEEDSMRLRRRLRGSTCGFYWFPRYWPCLLSST